MSAMHSPSQRSYTLLATPPLSNQALHYYSACLDVDGDVIMTLLLVKLCTAKTQKVFIL